MQPIKFKYQGLCPYIAKATGYSKSLVRKVAQGHMKNNKIEEAFSKTNDFFENLEREQKFLGKE